MFNIIIIKVKQIKLILIIRKDQSLQIPKKLNVKNKNKNKNDKSKSENKIKLELENEEDKEIISNLKKEEDIFKELNKYYYNIEDKHILKYSRNKYNISIK